MPGRLQAARCSHQVRLQLGGMGIRGVGVLIFGMSRVRVGAEVVAC